MRTVVSVAAVALAGILVPDVSVAQFAIHGEPVLAGQPSHAWGWPHRPTKRWAHALGTESRGDDPGKPDPRKLAEFRKWDAPFGAWGGKRCADADELRSILDDFLASPDPAYPDLGSDIPGASMSIVSDDCGTLSYAAGLRNVERDQRMLRTTPHLLASMTKPIVAALTLKLADIGTFGPHGLDTTVDKLLSAETIRALTVGDDPLAPRCPGSTYLLDRATGQLAWMDYACPDLSKVTLRDLMRANHGMVDFVVEDYDADGFSRYWQGLYVGLYDFYGLEPDAFPRATNGLAYLKHFGLKRHPQATIGGAGYLDFEWTWGNTGFQLLAVILEERTQRTLTKLVETHIVDPLHLDPIFVYANPPKPGDPIARGYQTVTGIADFEATGVYPLVQHNGHAMIDTLEFGGGLPAGVDMAGGAGGMATDMVSYRRFLDAYVNGGLLSRQAQKEFESSFLRIPDFDQPGATGSIGLGLNRVEYAGLAAVPDVIEFGHGGFLPGTNCINGVYQELGSGKPIFTGALCVNATQVNPSHGAATPFYAMFFAIMDARKKKH